MRKPSTHIAALFCCLCLTALTRPSAAADEVKQFVRQFTVGGFPSAILVLGYTSDELAINQLLDTTVALAEKTYNELNWQNPEGEVAMLNAQSHGSARQVSQTLLAAFKASQRVAEWTHGAFDITYASPSGNYQALKINEKQSTVALKSGVQVRFDPMMEGFLADVLVRHIYDSGMKNTMVKLGTAFRGLGRSLNGPWKVQVQDEAGNTAHRAANVLLANSGVAVISGHTFSESNPIIDPRSKAPVSSVCCRGVTIAMQEAAFAEGIAHAVFVLGSQPGFDLTTKMGNAKAIIIDEKGNFLRSPGF